MLSTDSNAAGRTRPRDGVELVVQSIWRTRLGDMEVPLNGEFFDLGGKSLDAVRIMADVAARFGVELPLESIFEGGTVERIARLVRAGGEEQPPRARVVIRGGDRPTTLVCAHPIGGGVMWYRDLANALPADVPCLGVQALGLDPRCPPDRDVVTMAEHYLAELDAYRDTDDVVLTGYSTGGLIAYEMARQLEAAGRTPRAVVLMDTLIMYGNTKPKSRARLLWSLVGHALALDTSPEELAELDEDRLVDRVLTLAVTQGALPVDFGPARLRRLIEMYPINLNAAISYDPPPYYGPVHLVRPAGDKTVGDSMDRWRARCHGGLSVHDVAGSHLDLISGPHAKSVAAALEPLWAE